MAEPSEAAEELLDAARYGDYADASAALDSGTPVNSADELGRTGELTDDQLVTSSTTACHNVTVHLRMMQHLDAVSLAGLHMACANGHAGIVHLLISAGAVRLILVPEDTYVQACQVHVSKQAPPCCAAGCLTGKRRGQRCTALGLCQWTRGGKCCVVVSCRAYVKLLKSGCRQLRCGDK